MNHSKDKHTPRVAKAVDEGMAPSPGAKWFAICDRHNTLVSTRTKRDAKESSTLDFCDECREGF